MNRTNTQTQLETLRDAVEGQDGRRRLGRAVAVFAAAAAVVVAIVVVSTLRDDTPDDIAPSGPVETFGPVDVATNFLEFYASFDQRAIAYLADDAQIAVWGPYRDRADVRQDTRWSESVGFWMTPGPCEEQAVVAAGTKVRCPFDFHAFGSDELGRGPYSGSEFTFTVARGKIVTGAMRLAFAENGFSAEMYEPFTRWVIENHPSDAPRMYADWPEQTVPATDERATRLWAKYIPEYVAAVQQGEAE